MDYLQNKCELFLLAPLPHCLMSEALLGCYLSCRPPTTGHTAELHLLPLGDHHLLPLHYDGLARGRHHTQPRLPRPDGLVVILGADLALVQPVVTGLDRGNLQAPLALLLLPHHPVPRVAGQRPQQAQPEAVLGPLQQPLLTVDNTGQRDLIIRGEF